MHYLEMRKRARELRKESTPSEQLLWSALRNKQLNGMKFLRQHPIVYQITGKELFFFIPDFYCAAHRLAIELDGSIHNLQKEYDINRDEILQEMKIRVLRFRNEELENISLVLQQIEAATK